MKYLNKNCEIEIPKGVEVTIKSRIVTVKGPRGELTKNFRHIKADLKKEGDKIHINLYLTTYKQSAVLYTLATHIKNMLKGVTQGFRYKMHTVKKHFPIEVAVKKDQIEIGRFLGGRDLKVIKLLPGVTCKKNDKDQDELWFEGNDKETISKVCATCYHSCNVKDKDRRKFLDGIYVSEKAPIEE